MYFLLVIVVNCGQPTYMNAQPRDNNFSTIFGSPVTFDCDEGTALPNWMGNQATRVCENSGQWVPPGGVNCGKTLQPRKI